MSIKEAIEHIIFNMEGCEDFLDSDDLQALNILKQISTDPVDAESIYWDVEHGDTKKQYLQWKGPKQ